MNSRRFYRGERLKSRSEIGRLFSKAGQSLSAYPLVMKFAEVEEARSDFPLQATFVVPKRRFKRATDRNLIKRRVREAYRLHKGAGTQVRGDDEARLPQYALLFIYTGKEAMAFAYIEKKMRRLLAQLRDKTGPATPTLPPVAGK